MGVGHEEEVRQPENAEEGPEHDGTDGAGPELVEIWGAGRFDGDEEGQDAAGERKVKGDGPHGFLKASWRSKTQNLRLANMMAAKAAPMRGEISHKAAIWEMLPDFHLQVTPA